MAHATATTMPSSLPEDSPFRAGVLPETQVLLAGQDLLTGLSSRAGLEAHYRLAVARARRSGARFVVGVAVIDVDPATAADEVFGHDLLVVEAARRLRACLRETDLIARVGETRFAFVAEEVTPAGAASIAARVARAVERGSDAPSAARGLIGTALWQDEQQTLAALLRAAEDSLGTAPTTPLPPDAANADSFGGLVDDEAVVAPRARGRQVARRVLGWVSLAALIALAVASAPADWRNRWLPLDEVVQQGWDALRAHWPGSMPRLPALPSATDGRP